MSNLIYAARPLLMDFLGTLVFVVLIALKIDAAVAASLAAAVTVAQVVVRKLRKLPVAPLQWMSLGLVLVFGAATVFTHDPRFVMVKPTLIYIVVGGVMLKPGWMLRYAPPIAAAHVADLMTVFGFIWAGLMFLTAAANLVVALAFTPLWPAFIAVVPTATKIGLFAIQYPVIRKVARRRIMAERATVGAEMAPA